MKELTEDQKQDIREILAEQLCTYTDQVRSSSRLVEDLKADSIDAVEIIMALEKFFSIEIKNEDYDKCKTVQDIFDLVAQNLK